jgi:hypothetical protein
MSASLDNYITGHFGEDQYNEYEPEPRAYTAGRMARRNGRTVGSYKCHDPKNIRLWQSGWTEEDLEMLAERSDAEVMGLEDAYGRHLYRDGA